MREAPLAGHLEARLDEAADDVLAHEVRLLRDLIGCQTVSSPEPTDAFKGEAERALDLLEPALRGLGFTVERWTAGAGFPTLACRRSRPGPAPTIGFNGHVDVVPIEDPGKWRHDPWGGTHVDNRIYGRGACDAKGAVITMIGEPSSLDVWIAEPGLEHVRIEVEGVATHALNRWRALPDEPGSEAGGVNAIDKAFITAEAVRDLEREWTGARRYPLLPDGFN